MLQEFEKLGYSTDPFLGNLTVMPQNLGTAMKLECELSLTSNNTPLDIEILQKLRHEAHIDYHRISSTTHTLKSQKTLAAACNEMLLINEFLKNLKKVCNFLDSKTRE